QGGVRRDHVGRVFAKVGEGVEMKVRVNRAGGVALALAAIPAVCAGQTPRPAVDVLKGDIDAVVAAPHGGADRQIKVVDVGKLNVGVGVLTQGARKTAPGEPVA